MKKGTSTKVATAASRLLDNPRTSRLVRMVAGSALTQTQNPGEVTSARVASAASKIMQDGRFSDDAKTVAASVLSQKKK